MELLGNLNLNQQPIGNTPGGPPGSMTPEMISLLTEMGKNKISPGSNRVLQPIGPDAYKATHWSQGVADMINAVSGINMVNRADQSRVNDRMQPPQISGPPQANSPPVGPAPAPLPPQGFTEAPNGQGAQTNIAPNNFTTRTSRTGDPLVDVEAPSGARFTVHSDYADRFTGLVNDLHTAGYNINGDQSGGYNPRNIRGSSNTPSQHSFGRAIDINWTRNPVGGQGDIPSDLARELAKKHGLVWGGDFPRNPDPMHFEIDRNFTPQQAAAAPPVAERSIVAAAGLTPPRMNLGGPPPIDTADAQPVVQAADRQPIPPQNNPAPSNDVRNRPIGRGGNPIFNPEVDLRPTFPTQPPHDFGLTPEQSMRMDNLSDRAYARQVESLKRQWEPQYTEMQGGRRWTVPATGQTGFIPTPIKGKLDTPSGSIETITIYDQYGRRQTYELEPTGELTQQTAPAAAPAPVAPASVQPAAPMAPEVPAAAPNPAPTPDIAVPPIGPAGGLNPATPDSRTNNFFTNPENVIANTPSNVQSIPTDVSGIAVDRPITPPTAAQPPVAPPIAPPRVPPLPNAAPPAPTIPARKSWLDGPSFTRAREIQLEQEEAKKLTDARTGPITQAIERGNEAVATREVVRMLQEIENMPNIDKVLTGPDAEAFLRLQQRVNGAMQAAGRQPIFDTHTVSAAEALNKLNTFLGSVGARQLTNRPTQFDFQAFLKANPGLQTSPEGRRILTQTLSQMAERDAALGEAAMQPGTNPRNWNQIQNRILDQHRMIINGNVLDSTTSNIAFDLQTGRPQVRQPLRGQILSVDGVNSMQFIGRSGSMEDFRNERMWVPVDPRNPSTWRVEMEKTK